MMKMKCYDCKNLIGEVDDEFIDYHLIAILKGRATQTSIGLCEECFIKHMRGKKNA